MSVSETFDRKFNKSMRGYNTEEVDAALDALLRYCDELEDANREFEIANNDLIDAKTELNKNIADLTADNENLEKQLAEMTEKLTRIEDVYNGYRTKFGEARDLITGAKSSAGEIIARANAKAELIIEDAQKEGDKIIADLDTEIAKRRELIEKLDISYNEFSQKLKNNLSTMLQKVESFNVMPIMPDSLPDPLPIFEDNSAELPSISDIPPIEEITVAAEPLSFEASKAEEKAIDPLFIPVVEPAVDLVPETAPEPIVPGEISAEPTFNTEFSQIGFAPIEENIQKTKECDNQNFFSFEPVETPNIVTQPSPKPINSNPVIQGNSSFSEIKSSLDAINKKVIEKKSTPYI